MRKSVIILLLSSSLYADNSITINQVGGAISLDINQLGSGNTIKMYDTSSYLYGDNSYDFYQNDGGVIDLWHIDGEDNSIRWGQGGKLDNAADDTFYYDGVEGGGSYARFDIHGSGNSITGWQTNSGNGDHSYSQLIFSDDNSIYVEQRGDGNKTLSITTNNDDNEVSVVQKDSGAHVASITLSGTAPTTLDLLQQGSTAMSYTLSQNCWTVGGCGVSITQGQ
tara:strand:+ start:173 stop:841 length:669 start_codon:yes stop_codon:yes gene_type:complete